LLHRLNGGNKGAGMQAGRTASAALLNSGRSSLVAQLQQRSSSMNSKISQVKYFNTNIHMKTKILNFILNF